MEGLFAIAEAIERSRAKGEAPVLATLVRVLGSGFRAPGARMLVQADGDCIGDLSGGCLDGDVVGRAASAAAPDLLVYDSEQIVDLAGGFGVGCPHRVEILLQPVCTSFPVAELIALKESRKSAWLAVACAVEGDSEIAVGQHLLFQEDGSSSRPAPFSLKDLLAQRAETRPASFVTMETESGKSRFLVERIEPARRLLLLGGNTLVEPLVRFARELGWEVVALQTREDRHPPSDGLPLRHIETSRLREEVQLDAQTYVVTMEHHQDRDLAWLKEVFPSEVPYIGVLGSRKRVARMHDALAETSRGFEARDRERLHGPIGLDIGASTPAEIALAIVAEVQAAATGGSMRPKRESVTREPTP